MKIEEQIQKAKRGTPERVVGEYLLERMRNDEDMARRYEENDRTLKDCMSYIMAQAKKKAVHNQCCMTDQEVFDLAVHYALDGGDFTTDDIARVEVSEDEEYTPEKTPAVKPKKEKPKPLGEQLSLF